MKLNTLITGIVVSTIACSTAYADMASTQDGVQQPSAEAKNDNPLGSLARSLFGDVLKRHGLSIYGWAEGSLIYSDNSVSDTSLPQGLGKSTLPQTFFSQTSGAVFNQVGITFCKGDACAPFFSLGMKHNVLGRITPTPAPRSEEFDVGFNITAMYGEDVFFLKTKGLDDSNSNAGDQYKFGLTQAYLDFYFPIAAGANLMVGSFQTSLANDVGYPATPPNWFATHTYAFAHGPAKHVGALMQVKIPTASDFGLFSVEAGIVRGWNNLSSETDDPHFMLGARWRSPSMKTWVDFESIIGNGQNDSTDLDSLGRPVGGGSPYLALSSTGEYLTRFTGFLNATHQFSDSLQGAIETTYGYQEGGDIAATPFAVISDSEWYGINAALRYKINSRLFLSGRAEWFNDENGIHVLWGSVGAGGGDVYGLTAGLDWSPTRHLTIRPEIRYDQYTGSGNLFAPDSAAGGLATKDEQFVGMVNFVMKF